MDEKKFKLAMLLGGLHAKATEMGRIENEGKELLKKFMALYGDISVRTDGVPHTITVRVMLDGEEKYVQKQIEFLGYDEKENSFTFYCTDGSIHSTNDAYFDDLAYFFEDLEEDMLEYMEDEE